MNALINLVQSKQKKLLHHLDEYREIDRQIKKLKIQLNELKDKILDESDGQSEIYNEKGYLVATLKSSVRTTFDVLTFQEDYPGVYENYLIRKTTAVSLRLK